jgi:hypothetical protein
MTPDTYRILEMAVRDGIAIGYRRAFKYDEKPDDDFVIDKIEQAVMTQICEWFKFEDNAKE